MKLLLYFVLLLFFSLNIFSQGLRFHGNENVINERTSYSVFEHGAPSFTEKLVINFDLSLLPPSNVGYIFRLKDTNLNVTYNLMYDNEGRENTVFKFNEEGRNNLITSVFKKEELSNCQWVNISLSFDLQQDSMTLRINDKETKIGGLNLLEKWSPVIYFGKSEHVVDIPSFAIKNVIIKDKQQEYFFHLNENEGELVHDSKGKVRGHVSSPVWLINNAYYWAPRASFKSKNVAGLNFNSQTQDIYFFDKDSITFFNVRSNAVSSKKYGNELPVKLKLGMSFVDRADSRLYAYEVYSEEPEEVVTSAYLDLNTLMWTAESVDRLPTQLHHHDGYYDPVNHRYLVFGGFGSQHYNKEFYSYDLIEKKWSLLLFEGDRITPRYFSSMCYKKQDNSLYVFGGMGNDSGDQTIGRRYYYDLYKVDLSKNKITKLWEIPWQGDNVVPVRNMIMLDDSCFYTLCYPEHFSNTSLKLYRFSIKDGSFDILGDSIPIRSDKITTNANLYYNEKLNELYCTVQEFDASDISSVARVYSLSFPPISLEELSGMGKDESMLYIWGVIISVFVVGGAYFFYMKRRAKTNTDTVDHLDVVAGKDETIQESFERKDQPNSIYLFGEFMVRDRNNKDITYMFSTKLKQTFLLILQYSLEDGISSQQLSDILWPDKTENKAKNLKGVTLNHIRKALAELDHVELIHDKGFFKIVLSDGCYCDYKRFFEITKGENMVNNKELIEILIRGKFLKNTEDEMFDSFKQEIENKAESILQMEIESRYAQQDYQTTLLLVDTIFNIDSLNEEALYYQIHSLTKLKMPDQAKNKYLLFSAEYKKVMNENYSISFSSLLNENKA